MDFRTPFKKRWISAQFQFCWKAWWHLWPHFSADLFQDDHGMPEYAHMEPWYYAWTFCFGPFQWRGYADV